MKKKIIVAVCALVGMSCLLGVIAFAIDTWQERNVLRKLAALLAIAGWGVITYRMVTLKYKWIKRLAE